MIILDLFATNKPFHFYSAPVIWEHSMLALASRRGKVGYRDWEASVILP